MFPSIILQVLAATCFEHIPLSVPWVPTGMKMGASIVECHSVIFEALACDFEQLASVSKMRVCSFIALVAGPGDCGLMKKTFVDQTASFKRSLSATQSAVNVKRRAVPSDQTSTAPSPLLLHEGLSSDALAAVGNGPLHPSS